MKTELQYATTFLTDTIKAKLPDITLTDLQTLNGRLTQLLQAKYEHHWYTDTPLKGSAFRSLTVSCNKETTTDPLLQEAVSEIGISNNVLSSVFPKGLTLWVDHNDVSARIGSGSIFPIYKKITHSKSKDDAPSSGWKSRPQQRPRSISPRHISVSRDAESVSSSPVPSPRPITRSQSTPVKPPPGFQPLHSGKSFDTIWNNGLSTISDNNLEYSFWNYTTNAIDTISHNNTMQYPLNYISIPQGYNNNPRGSYLQPCVGNNDSLQYLWKDAGTFQHGSHSSRTPSVKYSRPS